MTPRSGTGRSVMRNTGPAADATIPTTTALRRALALAPTLRRGLLATVAFGFVGAMGRLVVPVSLQVVIDRYILGTETIAIGTVASFGALALVVLTLTALANRHAQVRMSTASARGLCELRVMTFAHLHRLSLLHVQGERRGAHVARVTSDVQEIQQFLSWGGINLILGVMRVVLVMAVMVVYRWELALVVIVLTVGYGTVLRWFQRLLQRAQRGVLSRSVRVERAIEQHRRIAHLPHHEVQQLQRRRRAPAHRQ